MKVGFGKVDITPRLGVELCGFGPFLNRHSIGVRDRLHARAVAFNDSNRTLVIASCDLLGVSVEITRKVRDIVERERGIPQNEVMVHCTHTHSGPNATDRLIGWGDIDLPYYEILPDKIAAACIEALDNMGEAQISLGSADCQGIGLNREYDKDAPPLEEVLQEDWRPAKPELTDTICTVLKVESKDGKRLLGFLSYFGCHPVVCCQENRYIHGDYCGVAMGMLEKEFPGAVGIFLQGAQGDVNSCVVHKPEKESLAALDVIAGRFIRSVKKGLSATLPMKNGNLSNVGRYVKFSRKISSEDELLKFLAEKDSMIHNAKDDSDFDLRMSTVYSIGIKRILTEMKSGKDLEPPVELQGFGIGDLLLLAAPFEIFQAIKNDVVSNAPAGKTCLVMGLTNDLMGYALDRTVLARGGYAANQVPFMLGNLPFKNIHDELASALIKIAGEL